MKTEAISKQRIESFTFRLITSYYGVTGYKVQERLYLDLKAPAHNQVVAVTSRVGECLA